MFNIDRFMMDAGIIAAITTRKTSFGVVRERVERVEPPFMQKEYNPEPDLALLRTFPYLWDLRYWKKYKDPDEVLAWIDEIERWDNKLGRECNVRGNCNNLRYNIRFLLKLGKVNKMKIAKAILDNKNVRFPEQQGIYAE